VSDGVAKTPDLAVAAWLHMCGLKVLSAHKIGRYQYRFSFDDPEGRAAQLRVEFANSESARFDASQRSLKKLVTPVDRRGDQHGRD